MSCIIGIIVILVLLIILVLLLRKKSVNEKIITRIFEKLVGENNREPDSGIPQSVEKALIILFKNLTTTYHLFNVLVTYSNPMPEKDAYKIVETFLNTKNKHISDAALKASVRLLMHSNFVTMDIEEGYKPTPLGKELYRKLMNDE